MFLSYIVISNVYFRNKKISVLGKFAAYRGDGQLVDYNVLNASKCTARSIIESRNKFIENTLPAVHNSVMLRADVIHLNVHVTTDKKVVVFHDWTLDCATDGSGVVSEKSSIDLAHINAAYGYSWDNGNSYPFRDSDYRIQQLDKFLEKYPGKELWINIKQNNAESFSILNGYLLTRFSVYSKNIVIFTSEKGRQWFKNNKSLFRALSMESTKTCLMDYLLYGWSRYFPDSCHNVPILIPPDKTKFVWGYPKVLSLRAKSHGSDVYLWLKNQEIGEYKKIMNSGIGLVSGDSAAFINNN